MKTRIFLPLTLFAVLLSGFIVMTAGRSAADEHDNGNERRNGRMEERRERDRDRDTRGEERKGRRDYAQFPESAVYRQECSSCHFLYHPGLLPLRSWEEIIRNSDRHFGETLGLEAGVKDSLLAYFGEHSAEKTRVEWADRILRSIGSKTPARITESPYIARKHRKIKKDVFKRPAVGSFSNCGACHVKGSEGDFEEDNVRIPK